MVYHYLPAVTDSLESEQYDSGAGVPTVIIPEHTKPYISASSIEHTLKRGLFQNGFPIFSGTSIAKEYLEEAYSIVNFTLLDPHELQKFLNTDIRGMEVLPRNHIHNLTFYLDFKSQNRNQTDARCLSYYKLRSNIEAISAIRAIAQQNTFRLRILFFYRWLG